ncbi:uncharacterized protein LOC142578348 [Dermacentor variabilis]|uniref:uncharacterized protein LOC142578348 n=1 Tax=Dermacentor variabilis TaxID=34621 RepID=UPI003F5B7E0E
MKYALKLVCISQFLHTPKTTSYAVDDSEYLVDLLTDGKRELAEPDPSEIDDSEILFIEELTSTECSTLFHIAGFLAVVTYLRKMVKFNVNACQVYSATVQKLLISTYARMRLRIHLRQLEKKEVNGRGSKTCAAVNLQ